MRLIKKAIVTGANGFIGSKLVKELINESIAVYAIIKDENADISSIKGITGVKIVYCDMLEYETLSDKITDEDIDFFYHFSWVGTSGDTRADYNAQINNIVSSCKAFITASKMNIKKFIYAASIMEYEIIKLYETAPNKFKMNHIYCVSKLSTHLMLLCLSSCSKMSFCTVVMSNIYGPGELSQRLINTTIRKLIANEPCSFTHGKQLYDFIYIDDAVRGIRLIGEKGVSGSNYYLGCGRIMQLRNYLEIIGTIIGKPDNLKFGEIPFDGVSLSYNEFDINLLEKDTNFKSNVSFESGIKKTIDWIQKDVK